MNARVRDVNYKSALPKWWLRGNNRVVLKFGTPLHERSFLRLLARHDKSTIVNLWPDATVSLVAEVKRRGYTVVREMINCHRATSRRILDRAFGELGLQPQHGISEASAREETEFLQHCDFVFAPSPSVRRSLEDEGIAPQKILSTSFGWDPSRIRADAQRDYLRSPLTGLYVGLICIRKGAHLAVKAWVDSGVQGRLLLVGNMEDSIKPLIMPLIDGVRVVHRGFTDDISQQYAEADFFIFPSLEEGDPLVTYEAAGSGLPLIVSAMGAGAAFAEPGGSLLVDPAQPQTLVEAIRKLAEQPHLRSQWGRSAQAIAMRHTWEQVGRSRAEMLNSMLRLRH